PLDAGGQRAGIVARHAAPSVVGAPITRGEVGEALVEHRKETVPHRCVETQRTGVREPGAGLPGRLEERFQVGYVVRNPRKDRRKSRSSATSNCSFTNTRFSNASHPCGPRNSRNSSSVSFPASWARSTV